MSGRNRKISFAWLIIIGIILAVVVHFVSAFVGAADLSPEIVYKVLKHKIFGAPADGITKSQISIVWTLRLPRVLLAIVVGGGLAIAGAAMQAITQNVLAEPYMLGVSSGALFAVTATMFFGINLFANQPLLSIVAFAGSLLAMVFVFLIAQSWKNSSSARLVLGGMAISYLFTAFSNFFIITTPDSQKFRAIIAWNMGSMGRARWDNMLIPTVAIFIASLYFFFRARDFDMISLGEETALSLGTNVEKLKRQSVAIISVIAGLTVASCGLIGLVGFMVPHIVRLLNGSAHKQLLPLCFIYGGVYLSVMDILSRTVMAPEVIPIGIMTALFGAPFFIWTLFRKKV